MRICSFSRLLKGTSGMMKLMLSCILQRASPHSSSFEDDGIFQGPSYPVSNLVGVEEWRGRGPGGSL